MTCNACGEHHKKHCGCKDCTRAVLEFTHPEKIVTLRKVVIPASMGDDKDFPAKIGKYCNVILYYEANKHVYLYSSDGIPTLLESEVPQSIVDRIDDLEEDLTYETTVREATDEDLQENIDSVAQELEELKNSPDVVDIVATYEELQSYDTSSLGDKDVVRVLTDETHDNESSYYRWSTSTQTWTFIGATGPYYTKDETDNLLDDKLDASTTFWGQTVNNGEVNGSLIFEGNPLTTGTDISLENDGSLTIHAGSANWVTFKKTDNILDNEVNFSMAALVDIADGSGDTDAVNVRQLDRTVRKNGSNPPDSTTVARLGSLCTYVINGVGHVSICTAVIPGNPPTYTWQELTTETITSADWSALWQ